MEPIHFTTMPNFRGPNVVSATRSIEDIHNNIIRRIRARMPWDRILTRGGRTQAAESEYIYHLKQAIMDEGGEITGHTGTQQSRDIRGVKYPGIDDIFDYEGKKINGRTGNFCLNDTIPSGDNVYYIFLRVDGHSVDICKANELANDEYVTPDHYSTALDELSDCVERMRSRGNSAEVSNFQELFRITVKLLEVAVKSGMMSLYDYGQLFKFTTNFGFFKSRPRPNWFLSTRFLSRLREEDDEVPLNILRERLTQQSSE
tara:strand:- start:91 stop:867 length:777 start_codon:yes stop_codon:yes gene_type:complete